MWVIGNLQITHLRKCMYLILLSSSNGCLKVRILKRNCLKMVYSRKWMEFLEQAERKLKNCLYENICLSLRRIPFIWTIIFRLRSCGLVSSYCYTSTPKPWTYLYMDGTVVIFLADLSTWGLSLGPKLHPRCWFFEPWPFIILKLVSWESEATPSATPFFKRAYKISHPLGL